MGGGTFINGVTDDPSCQSACDGQSDCVGYDISINGDCWLIKDKTAQRNPLEVSTGLTHYSKVMKCDGRCCYIFILFNNCNNTYHFVEQ